MKKEITGNTFKNKEEIKKLGGRWNAEQKVWEIDEAKSIEIETLGLRLQDTFETREQKWREQMDAIPTVVKFRVRPLSGSFSDRTQSLFNTREEAEKAVPELSILAEVEIIEEVRRA